MLAELDGDPVGRRLALLIMTMRSNKLRRRFAGVANCLLIDRVAAVFYVADWRAERWAADVRFLIDWLASFERSRRAGDFRRAAGEQGEAHCGRSSWG